MRQPLFAILLILAGLASQQLSAQATLDGELKIWHRIALTFDGPSHSEVDSLNPFFDYRMQVAFVSPSNNQTIVVPGHFAADGDAAETGATSGNKWRVYFCPPSAGTWNWTASLRTGPGVATNEQPGAQTGFDGETGSIVVGPSDKNFPDLRWRGGLVYPGNHLLKFVGSSTNFLKGGPAGPETFLACTDFDGTYYHGTGTPNLKDWAPHKQDLLSTKPLWRDSLGEGIIGALDYLSGQGANVLGLVTLNAYGEGKNVWPWMNHDSTLRYDVSKLDQWERVFTHADSAGIVLHFVLQDAANQYLLDSGNIGPERMLYYREMVSRFSHHPAILWNISEQSSQTNVEQTAEMNLLWDIDPYKHPIFLHNPENDSYATFSDLLGFSSELTGPSLNISSADVYPVSVFWREQSAAIGRPWVIFNDEQNPSSIGVTPTAGYPGMVGPDNHDDIRKQVLYGNLMAGGAGVEYYFGLNLVENDMNCQDYRSRDSVWVWNRHALEGFQAHLPFWEMDPTPGVLSGGNAWCLAKVNEVYAIYAPEGNLPLLDLDTSTANYDVKWFDPRRGGGLQLGSVTTIGGPGLQGIGIPPYETDQDWLAIIKNNGTVEADPSVVQELALQLFPVPARDLLGIRWGGQANGQHQITVRNALGNVVLEMEIPASQQEVRLDCSKWPVGIYTLALQNKHGRALRKFTVQ